MMRHVCHEYKHHYCISVKRRVGTAWCPTYDPGETVREPENFRFVLVERFRSVSSDMEILAEEIARWRWDKNGNKTYVPLHRYKE